MRRIEIRLWFCALLTVSALAVVACGGSDSGASGGAARSADVVSTSVSNAKLRIEQLALTSDNTTATKAGEPDATKLATSFQGPIEIYAMVKLAADAPSNTRSAWLSYDLKYKGALVEHHVWAADYGYWSSQSFKLEVPCTGGVCTYNLPSGDYDLDVSLVGSDEHKSTKFTVADRTPPAATAKLGQVGLVQNWRSSVEPDPSKVFATSFKPADGLVYAAYNLDAATTGVWITAEWKVGGKSLGETQATIRSRGSSALWETWAMPPGKLTAGDAELTLTLPATGESEKVQFKLDAPAASNAKIGQLALINQPVPRDAAPDPRLFPDQLDGFDTIRAVFELSSAVGEADWLTATWGYAGKPVLTSQLLGTTFNRSYFHGGWGNLPATLSLEPDKRNGMPLPIPAGDYDVVLTLYPSGETKTLKFAIKNVGPLVTPTAAAVATRAAGTPAATGTRPAAPALTTTPAPGR